MKKRTQEAVAEAIEKVEEAGESKSAVLVLQVLLGALMSSNEAELGDVVREWAEEELERLERAGHHFRAVLEAEDAAGPGDDWDNEQ